MHSRRSLLNIVPGVAALALCGFAQPPATAQASSVSAIIQQVCKVVPELVAIMGLIGTFPAGTSAATIAKAFCAALGQGGGAASARTGVVVVRGVPIAYTRLGR